MTFTCMSIMQTIVTILYVWHMSFGMRMILTQARQQFWEDCGDLLQYLPSTTDAAVQQHLWYVGTYCN